MSCFSRLLATAAFSLSFFAAGARAQTPFTYQGKLESDGAAMTGSVHVRLGLYAVSSAGAPLRQETMPNVVVTNGLFTVTPVTFTAGDFPGAARWLQIEVSEDGGTTYTPLTPRQQVTFNPYSIYATQAGTAVSVSGNVFGSQIVGLMDPGRLNSGTLTGSINFSPPSGAPFAVGSTTKVTNLNADVFDGFDSTAFLFRSGGTMTGSIGFGSTARQMLNLFNLDYAIGVQSDTLYQRSYNDFSWFKGGSHTDTRNNPGAGGTEMMRLNTDGLLWLRPNSNSAPRGRLVFGDMSGATAFSAIGEGSEDDVLELTGKTIRIRTNNPVSPSVNFGSSTGQLIELFNNGTNVYGIGIQAGTQYFRTGDYFAWFRSGIHNDATYNPGTGGKTLMTLGSGGDLDLRGDFNGYGMLNRNDPTKRWVMYSRNSGNVDQLAFYSQSANADVAAFSPTGDLYLVGSLTTTVLTVRGGADVAEPFDMTEPGEMDPGSVVVIDEENPGKLKLSAEECDTRVAGIISGAGGVKPGLRLHQEGVMEGDHHVALSGRVYVKANNSGGVIKPGDLLTTSAQRGTAMKVKEHARAQGAILGKAMSKVDESTGLVLVLVTLQ